MANIIAEASFVTNTEYTCGGGTGTVGGVARDFSVDWLAETLTSPAPPAKAPTPGSVSLQIRRYGHPGPFIVSVQPFDAFNGHPYADQGQEVEPRDEDLFWCEAPEAGIPETQGWINFVLQPTSHAVPLVPGTKYCLVMRAPDSWNGLGAYFLGGSYDQDMYSGGNVESVFTYFGPSGTPPIIYRDWQSGVGDLAFILYDNTPGGVPPPGTCKPARFPWWWLLLAGVGGYAIGRGLEKRNARKRAR